jgi:hypothetical protein
LAWDNNAKPLYRRRSFLLKCQMANATISVGAENASTNASWLFSGTEIFGGRLMKKFGSLGVTLFVVLIALGSFGSAARADVVYEYSGSNFTSFYGGYTSDDSISGSLVFASALGDNLTLASVNPTSFSFSDGVQTISNTSKNFAVTPQFLISPMRRVTSPAGQLVFASGSAMANALS